MSKYAVKALVAEKSTEDRFYVWNQPIPNRWYHWGLWNNEVCLHGEVYHPIGTATTLEEAQAIVDQHHAEQVRQLLDSLIEFEPQTHKQDEQV